MQRARATLEARVAAAQRRLSGIYRLEVRLPVERFLIEPEQARELLGPDCPRTGLVALEEADELWLGLYFDPEDARDPAAILEETSHWLAVAWHAAQQRPVSALLLEFQAEVDRYAVARTARRRDPLRHFRAFRLRPGLGCSERRRYCTAHRAAYRYCRGLERRYPRRADLPGLLGELRRFYRSGAERRLVASRA